MINQERVALLVTALRSGEYPPAIGRLCRADPNTGERLGYCCLGVACEVAIANGLELPVYWGPGNDSIAYAAADDTGAWHTAYLPPEVVEWYGFRCDNPWIEGSAKGNSLASVNDQGVPQEGIANLIEWNFLKEAP